MTSLPLTPMSLRYQIVVRILLSSICILVLGGAIAIWQARQAVEKEVDASIQLALQLITPGISDHAGVQQVDDLSRFSHLRQTRHLSIQLQKPDGRMLNFSQKQQPGNPEDLPPAWFIDWVISDYPTVEHQIKTPDDETLTLIIKAQPLDEITEVWEESLGFFTSIALMTLLTFLAVNLVFNKSLKSIADIVNALRLIETGQYHQQLPTFATQEFDSIAKAINHMTIELEKTQQENRALAQHSLAIQEEERQHLSQELHDEFGQSLTAIKVMAVTAAQPGADSAKISASISEICDHLMQVVRSMMQQLHPLVLTELGLKATLEDMINHWSERYSELNLTIQCSDVVDSLDKNITRQIFRVIQECLTNIIRHAQAQTVQIDLQICETEQIIHLKVKDDGVGCNLADNNSGFGLRGMRERIKSLNGELNIQSQPGAGMEIHAWIPVS